MSHEHRPSGVVLVTGSSSGIGEAIARRLAAEGYHVVVNSSTSVDAGRAVADDIAGTYVQADVADEGAAGILVDTVLSQQGRLDGVINSAGTTQWAAHDDLHAVSASMWREILDVNLIGPWNVVRAAAPALREAEAAFVINISSIAGSRPMGSSIPYAVSKAGLTHLTSLLAKALGPTIRVNALAPGFIETPWTSSADDSRRKVEETVPARRAGKPDDVAEACMGLVRSTYVTGETLLVDGGWHLVI